MTIDNRDNELERKPVMMATDLNTNDPDERVVYEALEKAAVLSGIPIEEVCFWPTSIEGCNTNTPNSVTIQITFNLEAFDGEIHQTG